MQASFLAGIAMLSHALVMSSVSGAPKALGVVALLDPGRSTPGEQTERPDVLVPLGCVQPGGAIRYGSGCLEQVPGKTEVRLVGRSVRRTLRKTNIQLCRYIEGGGGPRSLILTLGSPESEPYTETLAVWPSSSRVEVVIPSAAAQAPEEMEALRQRVAGVFGEFEVDGVLEMDLDGDGKAERLYNVRAKAGSGALVLVAHSGKLDEMKRIPLRTVSGHKKPQQILLGVSRLDLEGPPQLIVLERNCNEYGVFVFTYGASEPLFSFDCGNC